MARGSPGPEAPATNASALLQQLARGRASGAAQRQVWASTEHPFANLTCRSTCGLVAMTSASHAEGRQFDPGQVYFRACVEASQAIHCCRRVWPSTSFCFLSHERCIAVNTRTRMRCAAFGCIFGFIPARPCELNRFPDFGDSRFAVPLHGFETKTIPRIREICFGCIPAEIRKAWGDFAISKILKRLPHVAKSILGCTPGIFCGICFWQRS